MFRLLGAILLLSGLLACNSDQRSASITGSVTLLDRESPNTYQTDLGPEAGTQWRAGEVLVKFKPGIKLASQSSWKVAGNVLRRVQPLALERTYLYRANLAAEDTPALLEKVLAQPEVEVAQLNHIYYPAMTSNDPLLEQQWHYERINLYEAWDIEKGTTNPVTVAVLDSGIVRFHPDFADKLQSGYDFVSDPLNALDGDGRDPDPSDVLGSSFHGTHVAGTIAAATNNGLGVAGVSWGAKILPVRVGGPAGPLASDIIDGLLWASGHRVIGIPTTPVPATVINMSLGWPGSCSQAPFYQDAINQALAAGSIVVVAAGNGVPEGSPIDANLFTPASCKGVITVGATDQNGDRASYSNYGSRIDVMAPGGDISQVYKGNPAGVLSTWFDQSQANPADSFSYKSNQGTSMAAPHVAGLIALLKSKKPDLTRDQVLAILQETARPLSATQCRRPVASDCGAGLIDARGALEGIDRTGPTFRLAVEPSSVAVGQGASGVVELIINRLGGFDQPINLSINGLPDGVTAEFQDNPVASGNSQLTIRVAASVAKNSYALKLLGVGGGISREIGLTLTVGNRPAPVVNGTVVSALFWENDAVNPGRSVSLVLKGAASWDAFAFFDLPQGQYKVVAWKDSNENGRVDMGDFWGNFTDVSGSTFLASPTRIGVNIALYRLGYNASAAPFRAEIEAMAR